eukprot:TRINITY_DN5221_c0_g1_i3.p1 TRINITY_DN5221_c0_g1~~TRINITY_DN5221_c0_g1_i3.p1  ORF type:complete len:492 (+),score=89.43 TRINITY_DN5221_c0_g1_i3:254-1729(+)
MWNEDFFSPPKYAHKHKTSKITITPLQERSSNTNADYTATLKYDLNESISPLNSPPVTPLLKPSFLKKKRQNEVIESSLLDIPATPRMLSPPQTVKLITLQDYSKKLTAKKSRKSGVFENSLNSTTKNNSNHNNDNDNNNSSSTGRVLSYEGKKEDYENAENNNDSEQSDNSQNDSLSNNSNYSDSDEFPSPISRSFRSPPVTPLLKLEFVKPTKSVEKDPAQKFAGSYSSPLPATPDFGQIQTFTPRIKLDPSASAREEAYSSPLRSPRYPSPPRTPGLNFNVYNSDNSQNTNTSDSTPSLTSPILPSPPISTPFYTPYYKTLSRDHHTTFNDDSLAFEEEEKRVNESCLSTGKSSTKKPKPEVQNESILLSPQSSFTSYQLIKSWNNKGTAHVKKEEDETATIKKEIEEKEKLDLNIFSTFFRTGLPAQQLTMLYQAFRKGNSYSEEKLCESLPTLSSEVVTFLLNILTQKNVLKKTKRENVHHWSLIQ